MRTSGILLPVFSLPSKYGIGCFSLEAYNFIDFLSDSGQTYWQILPLVPAGECESPYSSPSTFAGNPLFIDLEQLIIQQLLTREEIDNNYMINYPQVKENKMELLYKAFERSDHYICPSFIKFCKENGYMTNHAIPRPQLKAEVLYRYISGDNEFIESHTGLEDVEIETEILAYCYRQHKKMRRKLFE